MKTSERMKEYLVESIREADNDLVESDSNYNHGYKDALEQVMKVLEDKEDE